MAMTRRAVYAGLAMGAAYTWSPLTMVFVMGMVPLCAWGARGLGVRERRWVLAALVAAIGLRVLAIATLIVTTDPAREQFRVFFPDAQFVIARSWWILNNWRHVPIGPDQFRQIFNSYGASSFNSFLAFVQLLLGSAPYAVNLISVAAFVGGALMLFRLARRAYGPAPAVAGLLLLLFWPTLFAWSLSTLREATQLLLMAGLFTAAMVGVRAREWTARGKAAAAGVAVLIVLVTLRADGFIVVALGLTLGLLFRLLTLRWWLPVVAVVALGVGALVLARDATFQSQVAQQVTVAAGRHLGHVETPGGSFRLLDDRFYAEGARSVDTFAFDERVRFLLRSAVAFFTVPLPWRIDSLSGLTMLPQQCVWYALLCLAAFGYRAAARRDALFTAILTACVVAGMLIITPNSGNVGTLVRHRDMVVPAVVFLAAAGVYPAARAWA
ncbi:MAG: hypothetical protein LAO77_19535 [Acidobacteriia bacterium]|nr:hypothetical protein [Terriglobia bacterium]